MPAENPKRRNSGDVVINQQPEFSHQQVNYSAFWLLDSVLWIRLKFSELPDLGLYV